MEHLLTMTSSTGMSEDSAKNLQESIIGDINRYIGLYRKNALKTWNPMLNEVGSDRATWMPKWGEFMADGSGAYHQYNCNNHMTASAFQKLKEGMRSRERRIDV